MKHQKAIPKSRGVTLGMGVCGFFAHLFETNETLPTKKKFSDEQIRKMVLAEFPGRKGQFFSGTGGVTVNEYRRKYNTGVFTRGIPPQQMSFRYFKGQPVDSRYGRHFLIEEEIQLLLDQHKADCKKISATKMRAKAKKLKARKLLIEGEIESIESQRKHYSRKISVAKKLKGKK